jgi:hypothetical protein
MVIRRPPRGLRPLRFDQRRVATAGLGLGLGLGPGGRVAGVAFGEQGVSAEPRLAAGRELTLPARHPGIRGIAGPGGRSLKVGEDSEGGARVGRAAWVTLGVSATSHCRRGISTSPHAMSGMRSVPCRDRDGETFPQGCGGGQTCGSPDIGLQTDVVGSSWTPCRRLATGSRARAAVSGHQTPAGIMRYLCLVRLM